MMDHAKVVEERASTQQERLLGCFQHGERQHLHIRQLNQKIADTRRAVASLADSALNLMHSARTANSIHAIKTETIDRLRVKALSLERLLD